jgi:hypothetical protein
MITLFDIRDYHTVLDVDDLGLNDVNRKELADIIAYILYREIALDTGVYSIDLRYMACTQPGVVSVLQTVISIVYKTALEFNAWSCKVSLNGYDLQLDWGPLERYKALSKWYNPPLQLKPKL